MAVRLLARGGGHSVVCGCGLTRAAIGAPSNVLAARIGHEPMLRDGRVVRALGKVREHASVGFVDKLTNRAQVYKRVGHFLGAHFPAADGFALGADMPSGAGMRKAHLPACGAQLRRGDRSEFDHFLFAECCINIGTGHHLIAYPSTIATNPERRRESMEMRWALREAREILLDYLAERALCKHVLHPTTLVCTRCGTPAYALTGHPERNQR